jgi:hypothetical protein
MVAGYIRGQPESRKQQQLRIKAFASRASLTVDAFFSDKLAPPLLSGPPGFKALANALHRERGRVVILDNPTVVSWDDHFQQTAIIKVIFETQLSAKVVFVNPPTLRSQTRMAELAVEAIFEVQNSALANVLRSSQRASKKTGAKPYGVSNEEKDVIAEIISLRQRGLTYEAIASELNNIGRAPRRGQRWHPFVIARILNRGTN